MYPCIPTQCPQLLLQPTAAMQQVLIALVLLAGCWQALPGEQLLPLTGGWTVQLAAPHIYQWVLLCTRPRLGVLPCKAYCCAHGLLGCTLSAVLCCSRLDGQPSRPQASMHPWPVGTRQLSACELLVQLCHSVPTAPQARHFKSPARACMPFACEPALHAANVQLSHLVHSATAWLPHLLQAPAPRRCPVPRNVSASSTLWAARAH